MIGCEFDIVDIVCYIIDTTNADETKMPFIKSALLSSCLKNRVVVFDLLTAQQGLLRTYSSAPFHQYELRHYTSRH